MTIIEIYFFYRAANALNEFNFDGCPLSTRVTDRKSPRRTTGVLGATPQQQQRPVDFPLRILVQVSVEGFFGEYRQNF